MGFSQADIKASLPSHLRQFVAEQDYSAYTAQDHATWRYIMRQLTDHLKTHAHPVYMEGLKKTGITLEHIPSIDEMNRCLFKIGWKAVIVDGFIPPAVFMEFQALKILTIALDMRTIEHILYTPAPDIVHESAGHAPFIVDVDYAEYLQRFGEIGAKAMSTRQDFEIYEAIRHLSIIKEFPGTSEEEINAAEADLNAKIEANTTLSESSLLSRLHWWTVEYGLVGTPEDYTIFGAGLLSSLGESISCLDDENVKKIPLTVDAINTMYDITNQQPQLFVTKSTRHLTQVLEAFSNTMCFRKGGAESLNVAIEYETVATAQYSSGVQVSGVFTTCKTDAVGNEIYIGTSGPTQLAYADREIAGHGKDYHAKGFGSPVGRLMGVDKPLAHMTVDELKEIGVAIDSVCELNFLSGIRVRGELKNIIREDKKNIIFTFHECTVTDLDGNVLFDPSWGVYDMTVGDRIESVFAGSADKSKYEIYKQKSAENAIPDAFTEKELALFELYQVIRDRREAGNVDADLLESTFESLKTAHPNDWLLALECLELAAELKCEPLTSQLTDYLTGKKSESDELDMLIRLGLKRIGTETHAGV